MRNDFCNDPMCTEYSKKMNGKMNGHPMCMGEPIADNKEAGLRLLLNSIKDTIRRIETMMDDGTIDITESL